ncbi:hypothetical protein CQA20_29205, partial [Klebsiella pneumoniae]
MFSNQHQQILDAIKAYTDEHTRTPKAARAALVCEGIYEALGHRAAVRAAVRTVTAGRISPCSAISINKS